MLFIIVPIIFEFIFIFLIVSVFVKIIKRAKSLYANLQQKRRQKENMDEQSKVENGKFIATISNANDENAYWNSVPNDETYCDYCGSKVERVRKRCPSCGAKLNNK